MLTKLEPIDEIIKLILYSAYIKDEVPVSALIVGLAETGKTEETLQAVGSGGILVPTDCTAYGILKAYGKDLAERKIRHIILPDLITPLSRQWSTSASFTAFLNNLVEEGIIEVQTYAMPGFKYNEPVKCGVVACITPKELSDKRHKWLQMGFMTRFMPISWSYTTPSEVNIFDFICQRNYTQARQWKYTFPAEDKAIVIPKELAEQLLPLTYSFTLSQATKVYGFRYQKQLMRLAMASALCDGRDTVNSSDIEKIEELSRFLNLDETAI